MARCRVCAPYRGRRGATGEAPTACDLKPPVPLPYAVGSVAVSVRHGETDLEQLCPYGTALSELRKAQAWLARNHQLAVPVRDRLKPTGLPQMHETALLAQARVLTEKHKVLAAASGQSFNLFAILGRETDEVHTHSAIVAELLDPNGSHRQGPVFARLFAKRFDIPTEGIESAGVWRELAIDKESRIDIVMTIGDMCIVIENKVCALDRPRQLERYYDYASKWGAHKVIYLTLRGDEPGTDTLGKLSPEDIVCKSYETDVLGWLDDCIKEVARVPQLREILAHYQALVRKLTGKATGELVMDLKGLLTQKQGETYNFDFAPKIAEAMTALSVEAEWRFWQRLRERLVEPGDRSWGLQHVDTTKSASGDLKEVTEGVVRHAHGTGNKNKWRYGWTFRVESSASAGGYRTAGGEVLLRVECDEWGWGFYGFIAVGHGSNGSRLSRHENEFLFEDWGERLSSVEGGWETSSDSWIAWAWPTKNVSLQKASGWLEPGAIRSLAVPNPAGDGGFVEGSAATALVRDIQTTIDRLEDGLAAVGDREERPPRDG